MFHARAARKGNHTFPDQWPLTTFWLRGSYQYLPGPFPLIVPIGLVNCYAQRVGKGSLPENAAMVEEFAGNLIAPIP